jgi:hypothetical protein
VTKKSRTVISSERSVPERPVPERLLSDNPKHHLDSAAVFNTFSHFSLCCLIRKEEGKIVPNSGPITLVNY